MTLRMKKLLSILAVAATVLLTACDEHQDFPDTAMKVTHILTTDGKVMPYETYEQSGKQAIAVVFNINQREEMEGNNRLSEQMESLSGSGKYHLSAVTASILSVFLWRDLPCSGQSGGYFCSGTA